MDGPVYKIIPEGRPVQQVSTGFRLVVQGVSKDYEEGRASVRALEDISLTVRDREFVALLGPSGCGKSTLLRIIGGLVKPSSGQVISGDREVTGPGPDRGMVFQSYTLFPWLTVQGNIEFGLRERGVPVSERARVAGHYIELVGLRGFEQAFPKTLSGGMKQRVAIARALANDPEVLLLDEPFGALDTQTRSLMQELLLDIWQQFRKTIVFVTHDVEEAIFMADRVVVMSARPGRIKKIIEVNLPRPRDYRVKTEPVFLNYKRQAVELIREESIKAMATTAIGRWQD